jgi:hypothetical protein
MQFVDLQNKWLELPGEKLLFAEALATEPNSKRWILPSAIDHSWSWS